MINLSEINIKFTTSGNKTEVSFKFVKNDNIGVNENKTGGFNLTGVDCKSNKQLLDAIYIRMEALKL